MVDILGKAYANEDGQICEIEEIARKETERALTYGLSIRRLPASRKRLSPDEARSTRKELIEDRLTVLGWRE
jgi:hypothetical protein